jgi:hypothetical protein
VAITTPADTASIGKTFTISPFIHLLSTFILDWTVAEEVPTDQAMGSSAQTQDPALLSQELNQPLLNWRFQCHQIIQPLLNQLCKNSLLSLRNPVSPFGK